MQPNQPAPSAPPPSPYDFILNSGPQPIPPKKPMIPGQKIKGPALGKKQRILAVLGGLIVLLILFMIFKAIISSSGKSATNRLVGIAQEQNELMRIADLGYASASSNSSKNLAATTSVTLKTNLQTIKKLVNRHGHTFTAKELGLKTNPKVDAQLEAAKLNNQFDSTFDAVMLSQLTVYRTHLKQAYDATTDGSERQSLANVYKNVDLIIGSQTAHK
jgi:hypothetical protein